MTTNSLPDITETGGPIVVRKTVVIFDICCSTAILEDLVRSENPIRWQWVLGELKRFLWLLKTDVPFTTYKFVGDGWILLFDDDAAPRASALAAFMVAIHRRYVELFDQRLRNVLTNLPANVGITFGVDEGSLFSLTIDGKPEYVGRAINVAARLQSAVKALGGQIPGTALLSINAYDRLGMNVESEEVECNLRNVLGGERYRARRIHLAELVKGPPLASIHLDDLEITALESLAIANALGQHTSRVVNQSRRMFELGLVEFNSEGELAVSDKGKEWLTSRPGRGKT